MGARHVSDVYAQWSHLADRPFRVLVYMALVAKDASTEPAYWGGREGLCIALGLPETDTSYRIARRAVHDLESAGAIERKYRGHAGKRSEYRVVVTPRKGDTTVPLTPVDNEDKGGHHSPPKGGHLSPQRGTPESAKGDTTVPPRTMRSTRSESEEEHSSPKVTQESAPAGTANDIDQVRAKRVIRSYVDHGGDLPTLQGDAPDGLSKTDREIWVARAILATKETA